MSCFEIANIFVNSLDRQGEKLNCRKDPKKMPNQIKPPNISVMYSNRYKLNWQNNVWVIVNKVMMDGGFSNMIQDTVDMVNQASMNRNSDFDMIDDYK